LNIRNVRVRKSAKFLILLLISLIIALANAAIFYSLSMQPSVSISSAGKVIFVSGSDFPAGSLLGTPATWVYLNLTAYPNATLTYEQPLNISNTDTADSHNFRLRHVAITPASGTASVGNFTFINFVVLNTTGVSQGSFNYTVSGTNWALPSTTSYLSLPASTEWIIYVQTQAVAGASSGIVANIQIAVDVQ
jgi:hypothetical protein